MSLENLNKNLYNPDSEIEKRKRPATPFDLGISSKDANIQKETREFSERVWTEEKRGLKSYQKRALKASLWIIGGIAILALIIAAVFVIRRSAFGEEKVAISIEGPSGIDSTQDADYTIRCKNDNRLGLKNAAVILNYSENFQPEAADNLQVLSESSSKIYFGDLDSHSEKTVRLRGKFYAPQDYLVYLRAALEYSPAAGFSSVFQTQTQLGVTVKTSPIFLEIAAPLEAAAGNGIEYLISYKNLSPRYFEDVRVRMEYPEDFEFSSSNPSPSEDKNVWYLGSLSPNQEGKIAIRGVMGEAQTEGEAVKAYLGSAFSDGKFVVFTQDEKLTKMITSPLVISQSVNDRQGGSVSAGEELNYVIKYKNVSGIGLRDVIVALEIESSVLNFAKLNLTSGSYDSAKHTITWKASDLPELANFAPGAEGEIKFSIPVLGRIPVKTENDKNFIIASRAVIDSPDVPTPAGSAKIIASNVLNLELNSKVILETFGYHKDQEIKNFGPLPPRVGQKTSYVIQWKITNISNDIADAKVVSSLPGGVQWAGKIYPEGEQITFNERTNEIVWEIGKLESGTGILGPKRTASFQVSVVPQINQAGKEVPLLNSSVLTAGDLFTEEQIRTGTKEKSTRLPEDETVGGNYKVER